MAEKKMIVFHTQWTSYTISCTWNSFNSVSRRESDVMQTNVAMSPFSAGNITENQL